jgi:hypothetical protein
MIETVEKHGLVFERLFCGAALVCIVFDVSDGAVVIDFDRLPAHLSRIMGLLFRKVVQ